MTRGKVCRVRTQVRWCREKKIKFVKTSALTLTLSPRRGNRLCALLENSFVPVAAAAHSFFAEEIALRPDASPLPKRGERFSLSPGERAGVRADVKPFLSILLAVTFCLASSFSSHAQSYSVDWYKIAGGGGTSTGSVYSVTGTIGQPDASGAMSGGNYSVTGGFWSLINVVQTAGLPNLIIVPNGANSVKVLWPAPATNSYTLQQTANLATTNWTTSGFTISNVGGTNSITLTPPVGNLFFRLKQ